MTDQELQLLLTEKCETWNLKQKAFDVLDKILADKTNNDEDAFGDFDRTEIKPVFDGFDFRIKRQHFASVIRTRIGLYVEDGKNVLIDNIKPIGYYELETDFMGEILDDYFVIEKQKYVDDIGIISHFQKMNKTLPLVYLRRNHIQYEYVAYISLVGTLFASKQFESAGRFIKRAYTYLNTTDNDKLDESYLKESKSFLNMVKSYLIRNSLITDNLREELSENKNCG